MKFNFNGHDLPVIDVNGRPVFHGLIVCKLLGYADPSAALRKVPHAERAIRPWKDASNPLRNTTFVNEPGLYRLIFGSHLPGAEEFKTWVFETVIPAYREMITNGRLTQDETRRPWTPQYLKEVQKAINDSGILRGRAYANIYKAQGVDDDIRRGLTRKYRSDYQGYRYYDEKGKYVKSLHQRLSELGLDHNLTIQLKIMTAYELADGDKVALQRYLAKLGSADKRAVTAH